MLSSFCSWPLASKSDSAPSLSICTRRNWSRFLRCGAGSGQVDRAGGHHRRGNHEDDQQDQHDVDVGDDVDLVFRRRWRMALPHLPLQDVGELFHERLVTYGNAVVSCEKRL